MWFADIFCIMGWLLIAFAKVSYLFLIAEKKNIKSAHILLVVINVNIHCFLKGLLVA